MNNDDMLAYLANTIPTHRPTELRSSKNMLLCWLALRKDKEFHQDVILRHGLDKITINEFDECDGVHRHALGNAWGHCSQYYVRWLK